MKKLNEYSELTLSVEDLQALSAQGFVAVQRRGTRTSFTLRFRRGDGQHVRYLGRDPERAAAIQAALQAWQLPRQELKLLLAQIGGLRCRIRLALAEPAGQAGYKFHGRRLQQPRAIVRAPPDVVQDVFSNKVVRNK